MLSFYQVTLDNGLVVVGEVNTSARSAAIGFAARTGGRDETAEESGLSHFLEHMMFKGTERRTYLDINREFDEMGARYNAFTGEETTFYYANVLPDYLPRALDLLGDMLRPALRQEDFDAEKGVILEEIALYEDQPHFVAHDTCMSLHYAGHPLGNPVLGTRESIRDMPRQRMLDYFTRRYAPNNLILGCCGRFDWDELLALAVKTCGQWTPQDAPRAVTESLGTGRTRVVVRPELTREHLVLLADAPSAEHRHRHAAELLAVAVGDDTGSRLFWELVDPGVVDAADVSYSEFNGSGLWSTGLSCEPKRCAEVLTKAARVLGEVTAKGVSFDELDRARNKVGSQLVLRSEQPMGRLLPLVFDWQQRGEYVPLDDELARFDAVTPADIKAMLKRFSMNFFTAVGVGPLTALPDPHPEVRE